MSAPLLDKPIHKKFRNLPQIAQLTHLLRNSHSYEFALISNIRDLQTDQDYDYRFDVIIENQRGLKVFGIPLFSNKSLIPVIDPSSFQTLDGKNIILIEDNISNIPLPDLHWEWLWDNWYVLMLSDVDDQGWIYAKLLFNNHHWKGKYYLGNFIRRRVWVRLRRRSKSQFGPQTIDSRNLIVN